jgi:hypothetical protein
MRQEVVRTGWVVGLVMGHLGCAASEVAGTPEPMPAVLAAAGASIAPSDPGPRLENGQAPRLVRTSTLASYCEGVFAGSEEAGAYLKNVFRIYTLRSEWVAANETLKGIYSNRKTSCALVAASPAVVSAAGWGACAVALGQLSSAAVSTCAVRLGTRAATTNERDHWLVKQTQGIWSLVAEGLAARNQGALAGDVLGCDQPWRALVEGEKAACQTFHALITDVMGGRGATRQYLEELKALTQRLETHPSEFRIQSHETAPDGSYPGAGGGSMILSVVGPTLMNLARGRDSGGGVIEEALRSLSERRGADAALDE